MESTATKIVKIFQQAGYETYWAGGCVRDLLMGKKPQDYDIVTSALPDQIEEIVRAKHLLEGKTIPVGREFGIIMANVAGHHFEIATFRSDSDLSDGRRPDAVYFSNPKEDTRRRDFTINGLFYDPIEKQVIDYVNGQEDMDKKILRFIGDPDRRIKEDYLRLLRAARFKLALGFTYASTTFQAIQLSAHFVTKTSGERIRAEVSKMFKACSQNNTTFDLAILELEHTGLLGEILPEVLALRDTIQPPEFHAEGDVYIHTLRCLRALHPHTPETVVWAVLLHDIGKPACMKREGDKINFRGHEEKGVEIAEVILSRLRFSKSEKEYILWLIGHHMTLTDFGRMREAKRRRWFMDERFEDLLQVLYADSVGTSPTDMSAYNELEAMYEQEKNEKMLVSPQMYVNGNDIMQEFGLAPGKQIADLLEMAHDAQLEDQVKSKQEALEYLGKFLKRQAKQDN